MCSVVSQESLTKKIYLLTHRRRKGSQTVEMIFHQAQNPNLISTLYYIYNIDECKYYNKRGNKQHLFVCFLFRDLTSFILFYIYFYIFCYSVVHSSRLQMNFMVLFIRVNFLFLLFIWDPNSHVRVYSLLFPKFLSSDKLILLGFPS